jgi:hypothetical protein
VWNHCCVVLRNEDIAREAEILEDPVLRQVCCIYTKFLIFKPPLMSKSLGLFLSLGPILMREVFEEKYCALLSVSVKGNKALGEQIDILILVSVGRRHGGIWRTMHCRLCMNCFKIG